MKNDSYVTKNDLRAMLYRLVDLVVDGCVDTTVMPVDSIDDDIYNSDAFKIKSKLLTPKDIAAIYGIGINRARALMKTDLFPGFKLDGKFYVHPDKANEYFKSIVGELKTSIDL